MKLKYFQKGFNFSQDGPGNRLVYHLQGCNLICPWCANPEGMAPEGVLMTSDKTDGSFCPNGAVENGVIDRKKCERCNEICTSIPASGIKKSFVEEDVDSIVGYCKSCSMMFFDGGGVTLTGGEPTLQFTALKELLKKLKASSIHTALECNATHEKLPELFPLTDFLITDCKHYNSEMHSQVCGAGNENIIRNLALAAKQRNQLLVRIPLINGFNASENDAHEFAKLFKKIGTDSCRYEFLRYHEFGKDKYKRCSMQYTMTQDAKVSPETVKIFEQIFKENSLITIHT